MSMSEWAKMEVEIACKHENPDRKEGEFDYGCACYESALKAFNSLMEDGHSGFSIGLTKQILNRLIDGKPLVPIEDTDDVWDDRGSWGDDDEVKHYQCKRMSSLFKDVYPDGSVKYSDNNRVVMIEKTSDTSWHNGLTSQIVEELFPLTMPYMPTDEPYRVYCEECLTDPKNGDYDTIAVYYISKPDGEQVDVNRYFKEGNTVYGCWDEISSDEFMERKEIDRRRREELNDVLEHEGD